MGGGVTNPALIKVLLAPDSDSTAAVDEKKDARKKLYRSMREFCIGRRLGLSSEGAVLLLPDDAREGDHVVKFVGVTYPCILRGKDGEDGKYVVVGEARKFFFPSPRSSSSLLLFQASSPVADTRECWKTDFHYCSLSWPSASARPAGRKNSGAPAASAGICHRREVPWVQPSCPAACGSS